MKPIFRRTLILLGLTLLSQPALADRGQVVSMTAAGGESLKSLNLSKKMFKADSLIPSKSKVGYYKITYKTIGLDGKEVLASGLLLLPSDLHQPLPLISYQHRTVVSNAEVPSRPETSGEATAEAMAFASMGFAVSSPDYLGLGDSPGYHPYLHAATEATASADMIQAVRSLTDKLNFKLNGHLYLTGYSQGGHATLALHQYLEAHGETVTASAPMEGPYDLTEPSIERCLKHPGAHSSYFAAYTVYSMNRIYNLYPKLSDIFTAPYVDVVPKVADGKTSADDLFKALPKAPEDLFQKEFMGSLLRDPKLPMIQRLRLETPGGHRTGSRA